MVERVTRTKRLPAHIARDYDAYLLNACRSTIDWDANERKARIATLEAELKGLKS